MRAPLNDVSPHIGQAEVTALEPECELRMVEPQQMQDRGLDIMNMEGVVDGGEAELVGLAERDTRPDTGAGHPHGEQSMWWLRPIDSRISPIGVRPNSPPQTTRVESSRPRDFEVFDQGRARLVDFAADAVKVFSQGLVGPAMVVPIGVIELNEPDSALDQPACQQAVVGERRLARPAAIQAQGFGGLGSQVDELRRARLHLIGGFVGVDAGRDFRVGWSAPAGHG